MFLSLFKILITSWLTVCLKFLNTYSYTSSIWFSSRYSYPIVAGENFFDWLMFRKQGVLDELYIYIYLMAFNFRRFEKLSVWCVLLQLMWNSRTLFDRGGHPKRANSHPEHEEGCSRSLRSANFPKTFNILIIARK